MGTYPKCERLVSSARSLPGLSPGLRNSTYRSYVTYTRLWKHTSILAFLDEHRRCFG